MVYFTGYGGEYYGRNTHTRSMNEGLGIIINKKRARRKAKNNIKSEVSKCYVKKVDKPPKP